MASLLEALGQSVGLNIGSVVGLHWGMVQAKLRGRYGRVMGGGEAAGGGRAKAAVSAPRRATSLAFLKRVVDTGQHLQFGGWVWK